jgi:hypothetical protein
VPKLPPLGTDRCTANTGSNSGAKPSRGHSVSHVLCVTCEAGSHWNTDRSTGSNGLMKTPSTKLKSSSHLRPDVQHRNTVLNLAAGPVGLGNKSLYIHSWIALRPNEEAGDRIHGVLMRKAIQIVLALILIVGFSTICSANDIYLAQSAAGSGNGSSCANARAVSFFNSSGNWGTGATQIGPGTTVHLCGHTTTAITTQGNGTANNPIIIDGDGAATTSSDFTVLNNYFIIQNLQWPAGSGVYMAGSGMPHDILIRNNYFKNKCTNDFGDIIGTEGSYNVTIEGNYMENCATSNDNHDDLIQTWASGGDPSRSPHDWTIRYNYFVMNTTASNNKSMHMLEGLSGRVDIYGNVYLFLRGGEAANGVNMNSNQSSMVARIYGNTVVQKGGGNNLWNLKDGGRWDLENNIVYVTGVGNSLTGAGVGTSSMTRKNNLWYGSGSPSCVATEICGQNPMFTNLNNNDFSLQPSSPALGIGVNLSSAYIKTPMKGAQWPNPTLGSRASTGAWDLGALLNSSVNAPAPPTNLSVIVE